MTNNYTNKIMPYGWNLFQGGGAFEMYIEEIFKPLLGQGSWTGIEYIKKVSECIRTLGKPEPGHSIEEYIYRPSEYNLPEWLTATYTNLMEMFMLFEKTNAYKNWDSIRRRHYVAMPKGVAYEEQVAHDNPSWIRTEWEIDYKGGIDFIVPEDKILYSVKCTRNIEESHINKLHKYWRQEKLEGKKEWDEYNGFQGYQIKVLWYNKENNQVITMDILQVPNWDEVEHGQL